MSWQKLGLIVDPSAENGLTTSHMQGPVALVKGDKIIVYYAARDENGKSFPAYLVVDANNPTKLLKLENKNIINAGVIGAFDEDGVMPACALAIENDILMYYSGWNRRFSIPYHNTTGVAISKDGGTFFQRMFEGPVLERTAHEPYMAVTPWVMKVNDCWKMWYVSGLSWQEIEGRLEPVYGIKYGSSRDGFQWDRDGILVIPQRHKLEAIARPTVVLHQNVYHMWFCYRDSHDFRDGSGSYRIGYAISTDGQKWHRNDEVAGISASAYGWDSKMICYPYVVKANGKLIMFYNGNGFGNTGIGCAIWEGELPQ